ncbi:S24 family peptidase [Vibrio diabolicus]|uniref:S24 family peptidase n=1 Tax=Vibrio diabolicus TaxID=50719 RepID=UPI00232EFF31|nr:S24 family peptidase [Vibrio diabolicus]
MREWFLSTELVGLRGMANSSSGVAQKARRNKWLSRSSKAGNRTLEYHISNFHPDVKKQLIEKYVTDPKEAELLMTLESPKDGAKWGASISEILASTTLTEETLEAELKSILENKTHTAEALDAILRGVRDKYSTDKSNVTELSNVKSVKSTSDMGDMCAVPVYNVYASCGFGAQNDAEYQLRTEFLPCMWLKRFGLTEETARIIICHGDSMEDTLSDGDEVLVDIRELDHPVKHGVYVVRIGKHVYIKRLKYDIMAEGYEVISDNKEEYDSFIVNEDKLNEFAVIGKVVTTVMKAVV